MLRRTLNLGILAHVDAGKTTLTERLLYAAGVIDEIGSVDKGTTQTDSLALEQQRGITIRSAVVSFAIDDVIVNLIDTPGHPDFIAEVERVLSVLDGVVLVVSAVEGVQAQTRVLMRALERLRIPRLIFVNKADRLGADCDRVLDDVSGRLTPATVAMTSVNGEGTRVVVATPRADGDPIFRSRLLEVLAEHDDALLGAYLDGGTSMPPERLRTELAAQTQRGLVAPVFFGSAITGAGVDLLAAGIAELLPADSGNDDGPVSGTVFKIERDPAGHKLAYVRMFSGTVCPRDRLHFGLDGEGKVTAVSVFDQGTAVQRSAASAGEIAKLSGLREIQVGDRIGDAPGRLLQREFPPPTLESVVEPLDPGDKQRLRVALAQLAEQDPLIDVRQDDSRREISVSLYGEVQKEVIQATLADDFGIDVEFRETTPIHVERLLGAGRAIELLHAKANPFLATIGLRVEPAPDDSGVAFQLRVDHRTMPLYVYKSPAEFEDAMARYVRASLLEGLFGWRVIDCVVTMTDSDYSAPSTGAGDFRKLTPRVLAQALAQAGTFVCEPIVRAGLELPADAVGALMPVLARLGAAVETPSQRGAMATLEAVLPAARADRLKRELPRLTRGEGVLESTFAGYRRIAGDQPTRGAQPSGGQL